MAGEPSGHDGDFAVLLVESGLVTEQQVQRAQAIDQRATMQLDVALISLGLLDRERILAVMSRAWKLPIVDLATDWVDSELVCQWPGDLYLDGNWMPVRDQANGSVLVATARKPDSSRRELVAAVIQSPVEFAVAGSADIRSAVLSAFDRTAAVDRTGRGRAGRLLRAVTRRLD